MVNGNGSKLWLLFVRGVCAIIIVWATWATVELNHAKIAIAVVQTDVKYIGKQIDRIIDVLLPMQPRDKR